MQTSLSPGELRGAGSRASTELSCPGASLVINLWLDLPTMLLHFCHTPLILNIRAGLVLFLLYGDHLIFKIYYTSPNNVSIECCLSFNALLLWTWSFLPIAYWMNNQKVFGLDKKRLSQSLVWPMGLKFDMWDIKAFVQIQKNQSKLIFKYPSGRCLVP